PRALDRKPSVRQVFAPWALSGESWDRTFEKRIAERRRADSETRVFEHRKERLVELEEELRGRLHVPAAIQGDLPEPVLSVIVSNSISIQTVFLWALDAEHLAREIQVPLAGRSEERQDVQQISVRLDRVPVAAEVLRDA